MNSNDLLKMNPPPVSPEVDDYITRRLVAFYDGLVERGQIKRPAEQMTVDESTRYTADQATGPNPLQ
jgi:hypothetical protein